jgi:hypothetical protein
MLSQIAFQQIKDEFWYGAYGEFRVVMDKTDGYINATKMCADGGKEYKNWSLLNHSQELIQAVQLDVTLEDLRSSDLSAAGRIFDNRVAWV